MGSKITFKGKPKEAFGFVKSGIIDCLENIDKTLISNDHKLEIYVKYLLPAVRFKLTVHEFSMSDLKKLDSSCDQYLKKWLKIPKCGTPALLHCHEGLNIKSLQHIYQECHAIAHASSRLKADDKVNSALSSKIEHERKWTNKGSITCYSEDKFQEAVTSIHQAKKTPVNMLKSVKSKIKMNITDEIAQSWSNHIKGLVLQGEFLQILKIQDDSITWRSIMFDLPRNILQFAVNASINTLPTNSNLKRWGKRLNASCQMCDSKETLLHVLNNCSQKLDRYTWRHNSVLNAIINLIKPILPCDYELFADLPHLLKGNTTVPHDVYITKLKPDIVIINRSTCDIVIIELTVPFESVIKEAHSRKTTKYSDLVGDLEIAGYKVKLFCIEIGSRGQIDKDNIKYMKSLFHHLHAKISVPTIRTTLCKIVLVCSFVIYYSKYDVNWSDPSYVEF